LKTVEKITNDFILAELEAAKKKDGGSNNSNVLDCAKALKGLIASYPSGTNSTFSFNDYINMSLYLEIPIENLRVFFHKWVNELQNGGRVKSYEGVYDYAVHAFV
jgi:hypothetical protein